MFNSPLFRILIGGYVLLMHSFPAYAGLEEYITVNHKTDFGPQLVGSAYLDFVSPKQPVGIGWDGTTEASVTLDTASPFGFTGSWVQTPQVGRWKYNSSTQVTMPAPSQPVADIGLYFAPDREGYILAGNGLFATGSNSGYREIKIEGVGAGDNISTPALQLDAQAKINGQLQSQCQSVDFCELNLGPNDTLTFTLTPSVNTSVASLPALQVGTVPAESAMNRAALNLNFNDPAQVSAFLQQIQYVKLNTTAQGSSSALCSRQLAAFQSKLSSADNISRTGYFQDLTANSSISNGCVSTGCTGYSFLMSPGKSAELEVQSVNGTGDSGYVDYMFYFPGHFNTNNPQRHEYPGSHKTFRLRTDSTQANYSVDFSLPDTATVFAGAPYTTTVSATVGGFAAQSYQWSGASGMQITSPDAAATSITITEAGVYNLQVTATGANGEIATYSRSINAISNARIVNISTRANVSGGENDAFAGFVLSGSGTRQVMLRGIAAQSEVDPLLSVLEYNGAAWDYLTVNGEWENDVNACSANSLPESLRLPDNYDNDAGVLLDLAAGVYSVQLSSDAGAGLEVVGVDAVGNTGPVLMNISTRAYLSGGVNDIFAGFVITGGGSLTVMLRGISLDDGVDPLLTLLKHNGSTWDTVAVNDEWENDANATAVTALPENLHLPDTYGNDAGILLDLSAGVYTVQLSSTSGPGLAVVGVDAVE